MKILKTVIAVAAVFAMTIGSGFAMDNNPPAEPVKVVVETEAVEEAPQQALMGYGYYNHITGECVFLGPLPAPGNCSIMNTGPQCTIDIGLNTFLMYLVTRPNTSSPWACSLPVKKPFVPNS